MTEPTFSHVTQPDRNRAVLPIGSGLIAALLLGLALLIQLAPARPAPIVLAAAQRGPVSSQTALTLTVYLPLIQSANNALAVDPQSRQSSLDFYTEHYLGWQTAPANWTGDIANCMPGATDAAFQEAVLHRINYFRAMAGVPATVTLNAEYSAQAQAAALMMSANNNLNHTPPTNWQCYSTAGKNGAGNSNLALGTYGWDAITGFMRDFGAGNYFIGHRRWILYPQTQEMGTGDVTATAGHYAANALWVFDSHLWEARPATRNEFVAWPPPGYVPYPIVFARWSFSYPSADFSAATVTMSTGGSPVSVTQSPVVNGYGENTLVWIPMGLLDGAIWPRPTSDTPYTVNVQHVKINGASRNFTYDVIIFDPAP